MMDGRRAVIAAVFTAMGILGLAMLNMLFSPGYIWFYYAAFAALWWPLSVWLLPRRRVGFALAGSALTIAFLAVVNLQSSPDFLWFLYAVGPLVWWPVGAYFSRRSDKLRLMSVVGSALMVLYFVAVNVILSPGHLWFLYVCYPFVWWPIVMALGNKAGTLRFAVICSVVTAVYYAMLNVILSPGYPWAIYPAFAAAWWPLSLYFAGKRQWTGYSFAAGIMTIAFFIVVNLISSPSVNWAVYPIFAVLWWPMAMWFSSKKDWLGFSIAGASLAAVFFILVNLITSPGVLWCVYPIFAVVWWPLAMACSRRKNWLVFSLAGAALAAVFFVMVNAITSPGVPWAVFPIFAVLWWPLSMAFFRRKKA